MLKIKRPSLLLMVLSLIFIASCSYADLNNIDEVLSGAYSPEIWKKHLTDDLIRFWDKPEITDMKDGLFPTYVTNSGELLPDNPEDWPEEFKAAADDPNLISLIQTDRNFVRMHSRLTFAFGIAFHMTGDKHYLELCRKGALALIDAFDGVHGMHITRKLNGGDWDSDYEIRTAQDLAYGLSGIGMYYFLTHDRDALYKILQLKDFIFTAYMDESRGCLTWKPNYLKDPEIQIVSQLDQLYGYMLMITPVLPEPYRTQWKNDIRRLVEVIMHHFYVERYGFFWGTDSDVTSNRLGTDHTDFGHSIKTLWVILKAGEMLEEPSYEIFAREKIASLLKLAYIPETGSWASSLRADGSINHDKDWWTYAELDQACEILAVKDPAYYEILNKTHKYWFEKFIDKEYGEAWHAINSKTDKPYINLTKAHSWKSAFHTFEHALFGYMTSSRIKKQKFSLYYAFPEFERKIHDVSEIPFEYSNYLRDNMKLYMFKADLVNITPEGEADFMPGRNIIYRAEFDSLH